ncbi:MAG: hypothetical protein JSW39_04295, partial [Desulfobacterales bacterium]
TNGTFFQNTRLTYNALEPQLVQSFELSETLHNQFNTFLFGFTGSTGSVGPPQNAVIDKFQLSFVRPGDAVITSDPDLTTPP